VYLNATQQNSQISFSGEMRKQDRSHFYNQAQRSDLDLHKESEIGKEVAEVNKLKEDD